MVFRLFVCVGVLGLCLNRPSPGDDPRAAYCEQLVPA